MGLFNWFTKKSTEKSNKYAFSDDDRANSAELRQRKKEIELLKMDRENELHKLRMMKEKFELEQEIQELKESFSDDDDDITESDSTTELIKMFAPMFLKNNNPVSVPQPTSLNTQSPQVVQKQHLTDEQLIEIWNNTPAMAKAFAKKSSDDTILNLLSGQMPNVDDDTLKRALIIIKGK